MEDRGGGGSFVAVRRISHGVNRTNNSYHANSGIILVCFVNILFVFRYCFNLEMAGCVYTWMKMRWIVLHLT